MICTILIAALIFVLIHGWDIINPQNVAMYKSTGYLGNDRNQHYYGWAAYRNAAWRFPIGLFDSLTYPDSISIIFTDSIPLLAVIFKLFSAFLPADFQYFGLWGLACYVLVALISYRILYRATGKLVYSVLGSTLFVIAPIMLHRTMVHEALMGQWVVLYAMETLIFIKDYIDTKKIYIRTALLGLLASTIHMYFLLMCGIVMIGICIAVWIKEKSCKKPILLMVLYLLIAVLCVWILGGFSSGSVTTTDVDVLGVYSANLNTFTNPLGKSVLLQDKPLYSYGQADGTGYLGVGCILMVCIAICIMILQGKKVQDVSGKVSIGVVALISFAVAVSPVVSINAKKIFGFNLPYLIEKVWSNFRCYGRLIWIDVWLLMFAGLIVIGRNFHKRQGVIILSFLILLQCYDLHECFKEKYDICHNFDEIIDLDAYDEMKELAADASIKNVVIWRSFLDDDNYDALVPVYVWGVDHGKTLNRFYLARDDRDMFNKRAENALANKDESNLYIFETSDEHLCQEEGLYYKVEGDYIIARSCAW